MSNPNSPPGPEHRDENQRLTAIERDLAHDDPALARRMARFNPKTADRRPGWAAIGTSMALLLIGAQTLMTALRGQSLVLFFASIVIFCCVMLPVTGGTNRRPQPDQAHPDDRSLS
jgi:hypothetical protein